MKKFLFLVCTVLIFLSSINLYSQDEAIDPNFDLTIYEDYTWFNCDKPHGYLSQKDALFLLVYWNNLDSDAERAAFKISEIKKNNPSLKIIVVYNTIREEEKNYAHFRTHLIHHNIQVPTVIISDNDMIREMKIEVYPTAVLYSPRYGEINLYEGFDSFENIESDYKKELKNPRNSDLTAYSRNFHKLAEDYPDPLLSRFSNLISVEEKDWIFLAQPQNHRIVLTDIQGNVLQVFGSGRPGLTEGPISFIQFNHPQGMYWDEQAQSLYVADTYNNCIRKIDFNTNFSSTVLDFSKISDTSFPSDLSFKDGLLYVAAQGLNQVWTLDIATLESKILKNASGANANFISPRSVAVGKDNTLYVVEHETGKLVKLNNKLTKSVIDLPSLATHVLINDDELIVTSAYGDKVIVLKDEKIIETIGGKPGYADGKFDQVEFLEPSDILEMNGLYYVIDEGNLAVRMINMKNKRVSTLDYENMGVLTERPILTNNIIELEPVILGSGYNEIHISIAENNEFLLDSKYGSNELLPGNFPGKFMINDADINDKRGLISIEGEDAQGVIEIIMMATYYKNETPLKFYQKLQRYYLPVTMDPSATGTHDITIPLTD